MAQVIGRWVSRSAYSSQFRLPKISGRCISDSIHRRFNWKSANVDINVSSTPPTSWYTDELFLKGVEIKETFKKWVCIGRVEEVLEEGSYIARTIVDEPIVVVNVGKDHLAAYFNVCRHHAAQICDEGKGSLDPVTKVLRCPYHGWEYSAATGKLLKALQIQGCVGFKPKDNGLLPITVDKLGPWIFVNLGHSPTGTLLGDQPDMKRFHGMLQNTDFGNLRFVRKKTYRLNCNWKVFVDNYLDGGYHVPIAHPELSSKINMKSYKRESSENFYIQRCDNNVRTKCTEETNQDSCESTENDREEKKEEKEDTDDGRANEALYLFHYPNLCVNRYGHWMDTNTVWPDGVDKCVVQFEWFVRRDLAGDSDYIEKAIAQSETVQMEDITLCDRVQKGLKSSAYRDREGRYAPAMEGGEFMFHQKLHKDLIAARKEDLRSNIPDSQAN